MSNYKFTKAQLDDWLKEHLKGADISDQNYKTGLIEGYLSALADCGIDVSDCVTSYINISSKNYE